MDLAPVAAALADLSAVDLGQFGGLQTVLMWLAAFGLAYALAKLAATRMGAHVWRALFHNWRLTLLGATGLILSLASGWTTWDGMRNFTREPVLSLMVTFGIQGVMLIVAWLIGESFATGMNHRPQRDGSAIANASGSHWLGGVVPSLSAVVGVTLFVLLAVAVSRVFGVDDAAIAEAGSFGKVSDNLLFAGVFLLIVAFIAIAAGGEVWGDYAQATRVLVRSAVLWVMFLACMATSVFFSFDSLFSTIFPASERQRAAELRAQNQVAGVVADIGTIATSRRIKEAERLFQTDGWTRYEAVLDDVITLANRAPEAIREQVASELEKQRSRVAVLEEKRASAESGQAGIAARKVRLTEELSRVTAERPGTAAQVSEHKQIVSEVEKRLDEQRAVVLAEERGVEGSGKAGRGPMYRQAKADEARLIAELEVANRRLKGHADRLTEIDKRSADIKAELAEIDGTLAKLKGEAQTAEQLIEVANTNNSAAATGKFDPAASVTALEKARQTFRQQPKQEALLQLQQLCTDLQNAGLRVARLADEAQRIDCDPGTASEAASRVFALNVGLKALEANCIGGDKLPEGGGADALFSFARRCVQDSGLPSDATDVLRKRINLIELNRDDKAHRFVVTSNAFQDGNKLAYLALAIAIAIDSLVFMSGLFGANALRSPLSDVPSHKGRSARQLEDIVEHSLLPDKFENATVALEAVHPITRDIGAMAPQGWTHEVIIPHTETAHKTRVLKVLNAGATIGAVARDPQRPERYFVRGELVEFLATVAKKAFETDRDKVRLAELKKILVVALQPYVGDHADIVLGYLRPISEKGGLSSEVCLDRDIPDLGHRFIVQKAINAGTTLSFVQKDDRKGEDDRFYLDRDFYRTLAMIASEFPRHGRTSPHPLHQARHGALPGGSLDDVRPAVATQRGTERLITQEVPQPEPRAKPASQQHPAWTEGRDAAQPAASIDDIDALAREMHEKLIEGLRLSPNAYGWAIGNIASAEAANAALDELVRKNDNLGRHVHEIFNDAQNSLNRVFAGLASQLDAEPEASDRLIAERRHLEELLPLLLLAPGSRYHRVLGMAIVELEAAAGDGQLLAYEQDELERLRVLQRAANQAATAGAALAAIDEYVNVDLEAETEGDRQSSDNVTRFPGPKVTR